MNKRLLKIICLLFISSIAIAQSKDEINYKERAVEVQQEVWGTADKAFDVTTIPDKYKNASAVIIARSLEVTNSTKRKFKMVTMFGGTVKQYRYFTTIREKVLINDKAALEDFSTLNYKKKIDNSLRSGVLNFKDISKTFIGAKIFKQNGKIININPDDEEVLTKNTNKDKEGKLAIPDLQTGDILDYYIRIEELIEDNAEIRGPDVFYLGAEYPMLYYSAKYILDKKCGADIMSANGAKPMIENINQDDDIVLEFTETDLPVINSSLWTNKARQIPYHVVRYGFPGSNIAAGRGEVKRGPFTDFFKNQLKERFIEQIRSKTIDFAWPENILKDYFNKKKDLKNWPPDSIVNFFHNFYCWGQYDTFRDMEVSTKRNYASLNIYDIAVSFSEVLRNYDIDNDIVIVRNRFSGRLKEVFGLGDFEPFVRVNSNGKLIWMCFTDFFQNTGQLPAIYQGEEALVLTREGKDKKPKYADAETPIKLPVSKANENMLIENLNVSFKKDNLQVIAIDRNIKETGALKQDDQKKLILAEDAEAGLAALLKRRRVNEYTAELNKKSKALAIEIQVALDKERLKQKDYFKQDIEDQYEQEPKELLSYKIINNGFDVNKSTFEYNEIFTMDNFVKKAGNNFIFEVGRLMGAYKKVDEKERNRILDIYMPCARTLSYNFTITVPEGYNVKGVEELNKKVENEIASFTSAATITGNTINVTVTRVYINNFEPVANWPKLLSAMDAAADFTNSKILLEKKK